MIALKDDFEGRKNDLIDISIHNELYKIRALLLLDRSEGTAHGGYLMKASARPTLEIVLNGSLWYLKREMDKDSGILLIKI
ncbi:MAG TPA: hypothetical protein VFI29_11545 [Hanamia sp.]|nr:hypothetical protein [Hanamia sp.]